MLLTVAEGFRRIRVDFDNQTVRAHRDSAPAKDFDQVGPSATLARVDYHRQVGFLFGGRHGGEVQGVAGVAFEGPDASFAENDIGVSVREKVFGGEQPLLDAHAHAAFEQDGFAAAGTGDEKLKVLRVAGPDLQDVGRPGHKVDITFAQNLGDDTKSGFPPGLGQQTQSLRAETLEFVGRCARFVGAPAEDNRAGGFDRAGGRHELLLVLHRTRPGHHHKRRAADLHAPGIDDRARGVGFPAGQLVALLHAKNPFDLGQRVERFEAGVGCLVADGRHNRLVIPMDGVGHIAQLADLPDDFFDLLLGRMGTDDNDHNGPRLAEGGRAAKTQGFDGENIACLGLRVGSYWQVPMNEKEEAAIKALVAQSGCAHSPEMVEELIATALRLGRDKAPVADLKLFVRALKELRYASKVFQPYSDRRKVAVFGSARLAPETAEFKMAEELGQKIVQHGFMVITGGGDGIMGAAQKGAGRDNGFGLNIRLPFEQRANETIHGDKKLINFNYFFTRKVNFVKETDAFILFPGGFGTQDEGFECLTLMQTGKAKITPLILLDTADGRYWETWEFFIKNDLLRMKLISQSDFHLFKILHSCDEAIEHIRQFYKVFDSYRWVREKMVIRIKAPLTTASLARLNEKFGSILLTGSIEQTGILAEEAEARPWSVGAMFRGQTDDLTRIVLTPKKTDFGALRQLIDTINESETEA